MKEIVIKISDDVFSQVKQGRYAEFSRTVVGEAIKNGKVLPKGHGRLIDADNISIIDMLSDEWEMPNAETLVEADKEEEK